MKVFISWSGEASRLVAQALREWLPQIIQAVKPWLSEKDINKGARWHSDLAKNLEETSVGIFCLTKENLTAPWILFEAGAVSKKVEESFVCTYLIGLTHGDVTEPLSQFQATIANKKEDTRKLLMTINQALKENALKEDQLNKAFEKWWPDLEEKLKSKPFPKPESKRDTRELLEEILSIVRELARGQYQQTFQAIEEILGTTLGPDKEEGINLLRELRNRDWRGPLIEALCRLKAETTAAGTYTGKEMGATLIRKK